MEKILLFQSELYSQIKAIASPLRIRVEEFDAGCMKTTLDELYSKGKDASYVEAYTGEVPKESLLVFCNVEDKKLDKILAQLKKKGLHIDYKAVMTPTNAKWNILRIFFEMEREKKAYEAMMKQ